MYPKIIQIIYIPETKEDDPRIAGIDEAGNLYYAEFVDGLPTFWDCMIGNEEKRVGV